MRPQLRHALGLAALVPLASAALAQTLPPPGPRLFDQGRTDVQPPRLRSDAPPAPANPTPGTAAAPAAIPPFTLREVRVEGAASLPAARIAATWQALRGTEVGLPELVGITNAIAGLYEDAGFALHSVVLPQQDLAGGIVRIRVAEGYVDSVTIEGDTDGADLSLLQGYAARIVAERPLRRATLERYILLMNDIPGLKVGSAFQPMPGVPGAARLALAVERKSFEFGSGVNNLGAVPLGRTQFDLNVVANSLLTSGDRAQATFGFPAKFERYQYYGGAYSLPVGTDGTTLRLSGGYLRTRDNGNFAGTGFGVDGNAFTYGALLAYPVIRAPTESLLLTGAFDATNANSAVIGFTLSDERTRAVRAGIAWAKQDSWDGVTTANLTLSGGLDALGARRGSVLAGDPEFFKGNLLLGREQALVWNTVLRLRGIAQAASEALPATEQFLYGGLDFGRAFGAATLAGDSGIAGSAELAWRLPEAITPSQLQGSEVYGFIDGARVWNEPRGVFRLPKDRAASAGVGLRAHVLETVQLQVEGAASIENPRYNAGRDDWRLVFSVRSLL